MEIISNYITEFLNIPGVQVAISVLSLVYGAIRVISATSIGKKAINELRAKFSKSEKQYNDLVEEHNAIISEKDSQFIQLKTEYETKLYCVEDYTQKCLTSLKTALSKINNEQVQKVLENIDLTIPNLTISEEIEQVKAEYELKYEVLLQRIEVLEHGKKEEINNESVEE